MLTSRSVRGNFIQPEIIRFTLIFLFYVYSGKNCLLYNIKETNSLFYLIRALVFKSEVKI